MIYPIFNMAAVRHLEFVVSVFGPRQSAVGRLYLLRNFVEINAVHSSYMQALDFGSLT